MEDKNLIYICSTELSEYDKLDKSYSNDSILSTSLDEFILNFGEDEEIFKRDRNVVVTNKKIYIAVYQEEVETTFK